MVLGPLPEQAPLWEAEKSKQDENMLEVQSEYSPVQQSIFPAPSLVQYADCRTQVTAAEEKPDTKPQVSVPMVKSRLIRSIWPYRGGGIGASVGFGLHPNLSSVRPVSRAGVHDRSSGRRSRGVKADDDSREAASNARTRRRRMMGEAIDAF